MQDLFTISASTLPEDTRVVGFRGSEGISRVYVFEIYLSVSSSESQEIDLADVVGAKATLTVDRQDGRPPFVFHGIFSELSLVHEMGDRTLVRALLVPRLWRLGQNLHSRMFTQMTIPEIITTVLEDGGLTSDEYVFKLSDKYAVEEHVCQYRESQLDFISRWMEREGLYYYFEQTDEGEKLVISDSKAFQHELDKTPVRFHPLTGSDVSAKESLHSFICRRRALPGTVKLKDHDYAKPTLDVSARAVISKTGLGEINLHGSRFFSPDAGKRLAERRAEVLISREVVYTASGTALYLRAGYTFDLQDHPRPSFDTKYFTTEVEHYGNQGASTADLRRLTGLDGEETYRVELTAIPTSVQYRSEEKTPWPRVYGTEFGVIDGEADSEYAQIDDDGRYLVRFAFDESDLKDGKASTRVRMMQPHGGGVEGWHFPLRKGTEVLFTFLGGDPDRPVIAGVVPNAHTPSPVTKANHTTNVIQTGGKNRFELEDKAGSERITLKTPHSDTMIRMGAPNDNHNLIVRTDGRSLIYAGQDMDVHVGGKLFENVDNGHTEFILAGGWHQDVTGSSRQLIKGKYLHRVSAEDHDDYGSWKTDVKGTWEATVGGNITITCTAGVVHISSPTEVTIKAPVVKNDADTVYTKGTSFFFDYYGVKTSLGAVKFDNTGLNMSINATKVEATGMATAATGMKMEKVALGASYVHYKIDGGFMRNKNVAAEVSTATVLAYAGGFASFAKGLLKIG